MMDWQNDASRDVLQLRGGLVLYPAQQQVIERVLADLLQKLPARLILLTESSGQAIAFQGNQRQPNGSELDPVALGALVAGDLAASMEIARLTGEYHAFQLVLRQGEQSHIFIADAGRSLALLVQVASRVPLGWARMLIVETAHSLAEILAEPPPEQTAPALDLRLNQDLTEMVGNALDSMWSEDDDVH